MQETVVYGQAAQSVLERDLANVKESSAAFETLTARLAEYDKLFKASCEKVSSEKEEITSTGSEKAESKSLIAEHRKESGQRLLSPNTALFMPNPVERLTNMLVCESVSVVDAVH